MAVENYDKKKKNRWKRGFHINSTQRRWVRSTVLTGNRCVTSAPVTREALMRPLKGERCIQVCVRRSQNNSECSICNILLLSVFTSLLALLHPLQLLPRSEAFCNSLRKTWLHVVGSQCACVCVCVGRREMKLKRGLGEDGAKREGWGWESREIMLPVGEKRRGRRGGPKKIWVETWRETSIRS